MGIHEGHRRRMKDKIAKSGFETFADHEVLEAILFYAIPYRDTNPTAHAILDRFGSLSSLLTAPASEIASVPGCGERTAEFFALFAEAGRRAFLSAGERLVYDSPESIRSLALKTVEHTCRESTYLLLFDNRFSLLDSRLLFEGYIASASLRPNMIAEPALLLHASCAVLVTRHENRIACPDPYERETARYLAASLAAVGVHLIDHYVVGGNLAIPILKTQGKSFPVSVASNPASEKDKDSEGYSIIPPLTKYSDVLSDEALLDALFGYLMPTSPSPTSRLLHTAGSFSAILQLNKEELAACGVTPHAISFFSTFLSAWGRCIRSEHPTDTPFAEQDKLGAFFTACFAGMQVEGVYLLLLREDKTYLDCRRVAVGSINSANFNTRALLEKALFSGARHAVIAHNHPGGNTHPSDADIETTRALHAAFRTIDVNLIGHFVIAGNGYFPICIENN